MHIIKLISIFILVTITGCTTTPDFKSIPVTGQDFSQSIEEIKREFSDVRRFQRPLKDSQRYGDLHSLEQQWGKAESVETQWTQKIVGTTFMAALVIFSTLPAVAFAAIESMYLYPLEKHHWKKENIHIEAIVAREGFHGYERKVVSWKWDYIYVKKRR
ncbi:MAG: hypothetical protein KAJ19_04300 [Gammaproteobacteria bacterium]|nr:hypothetical protein [Gammaproteobacteria bacterium]